MLIFNRNFDTQFIKILSIVGKLNHIVIAQEVRLQQTPYL
jgi:hypothetical protein